MPEQTEHREPLDPRVAADLIQAAVTAAGFASQEAVHMSLTRKLERVATQTARVLEVLAVNPGPDLTILTEHIGGIVREAQTSAVQLDLLATLAGHVAELRDRVAAGSGSGSADGPAPGGGPAATLNETGDGNG